MGAGGLLNDQMLSPPRTAGDPEPAVDDLGVAFIGGLDGGKHAEAVASGVDILWFPRTEKGVEDV